MLWSGWAVAMASLLTFQEETMRRFMIWLLTVALFLLPACGMAEEPETIGMEGEWYAVMLYSRYVWPLERAACSKAELPEDLIDLLGLEEPGFLQLTEDAVLMYEWKDGVPLLAIQRSDGGSWICNPAMGGSQAVMLRFEDGKVFPEGLAESVEYTFVDGLLSLTFMGEELAGEVIPYGEEAFELPFTEEEYVNIAHFGVPRMLFVRRSAIE